MGKDLVIYHGNCDDGFGAAFAHWFWTSRLGYSKLQIEGHQIIKTNTAYYYEGYYGKDFPWQLLREEFGISRVFIVDFSYDPEKLSEICGKVERVILIDHHKTAIEKLAPWLEVNSTKPNNLQLILHNDYSGAQLSWTYFSGYSTNTYPAMIAHIGDNDLWKFQINETKEFMQALRSYPRTFEEWFEIYMKTDRELQGYEKFVKEGKSIQRYTDNLMQDIIAQSKTQIVLHANNKSFTGLCCNSPKIFSSDIGNILAKESGTFGMTWFLDKDELVICSIRSIGDFDISEIAKNYRGGGHKNASGFTLNSLEELQDKLNANILE